MKEFKRIFIFGCSFSNFRWPTWADMVRYSADKPFQNWGQKGIGNVAIMHKMVECDLKNNLNEDDLLIAQWSTWTREDRFYDHWWGEGGVFHNPKYGDEFCEKWWTWNNDIVKNSTAIIAANKMYNFDYQFNFWGFPNEPDFNKSVGDVNIEMQNLYRSNLPQIDNFPVEINTNFEGTCHDGHGDIKSHLHFFKNNITPRFGFELSPAKEKQLLDLHYKIADSLDIKKQDYGRQMEIIAELVGKVDPTIYKGHLGF